MSDGQVDDGGPAFPVQEFNSDGTPATLMLGMTLRDYFAAKAMQALYLRLGGSARCSAHDGGLDYLAQGAYEAADAMLKARKS